MAILLFPLVAGPARAQAPPNPREAQPERPTVATHAYAVAPGYAELEAGWEWDHNSDGTRGWAVPLLLKVGIVGRVQAGLQLTLLQPPGMGLGVGDLALVGKRGFPSVGPLLGDLAVQAGLKLPIGAGVRSTGTTDVSLLLVSSHQLGAVSLDLNLGYTRRSGSGGAAPRNSTLVTVAGGWPVASPLGFTVEVFAYPGTSGPAGSPAAVALLGGPTWRLSPAAALDLGGIVRLTGSQANAVYAGITWHLGRLLP